MDWSLDWDRCLSFDGDDPGFFAAQTEVERQRLMREPAESELISPYNPGTILDGTAPSAREVYEAGQDQIHRQAEASQLLDRELALIGLALLLAAFPLVVAALGSVRRSVSTNVEAASYSAGRAAAGASKVVAKAAKALGGGGGISHGSLSTADELAKWVRLRDEGLVTEAEFQKMRAKLLGE